VSRTEEAEGKGLPERSELTAYRLLLISAEVLERTSLRETLVSGGYEVEVAADLATAFKAPLSAGPDVIVVNPLLPDAEPGTVLTRLNERWPRAVVVMIHAPVLSAALLEEVDDYLESAAAPAFALFRIDRALERRDFLKADGAVEPAAAANADSGGSLIPRSRLIGLADLEIARVRRYRSQATLLACAIDSFAKIRDRHGHRASTEMRRALARLLLRCVRDCDAVAALADDTFGVLLTHTDRAHAQAMVARVRAHLGALPAATDAEPATVSFGLCTLSSAAPGISPREWFQCTLGALRGGQRKGAGSLCIGELEAGGPPDASPRTRDSA